MTDTATLAADLDVDALRNTPVQTRSAKTLKAILDAGREVLAEVGRDRLTTAMVADRAGVSIGTFYRYYPDRVPLLNQIQPNVFFPRTITTAEEIEVLPTGSVLMCRVGEVFHLHAGAAAEGHPVWLAAGYPNVWTVDQVAEWAPLTLINERAS